jgi:hypothetical protein
MYIYVKEEERKDHVRTLIDVLGGGGFVAA